MTAPSPQLPTGRKIPRTARGFTLLELLVALAILAGGLALVLAAFSQALDRSRQEARENAAVALESALLAQAMARPDGPPAEADGNTNGYSWRVVSEPYGSPADRSAWALAAVTVRVTVSWHDGLAVRRIAVSSLRLLPKPAS